MLIYIYIYILPCFGFLENTLHERVSSACLWESCELQRTPWLGMSNISLLSSLIQNYKLKVRLRRCDGWNSNDDNFFPLSTRPIREKERDIERFLKIQFSLFEQWKYLQNATKDIYVYMLCVFESHAVYLVLAAAKKSQNSTNNKLAIFREHSWRGDAI